MKIDLTGESEKDLRSTGEHVRVKMRFYNYRIDLPELATKVNVKTADDFKNARWFSRNELPNLNLSPPTISSLNKLGFL